jgi:hypothetical protein
MALTSQFWCMQVWSHPVQILGSTALIFYPLEQNVSMLFGWVKLGCFVACILILFLLGFGANNKKFIA